MIETLIVIAKSPIPGRVKTRLAPQLSHNQAAELAAAALDDTLAAIDATPCGQRLLAFDGPVGSWLRPGWRYHRQSAGGLDDRIADVFGACGGGPAMLVGMDTPQLTSRHLRRFDPSRYDACLGPADDGGYWTIGFVDPSIAGRAVRGVQMSTPDTCRDQVARLAGLGLRVQMLDPLRDVDTIDDAEAVAALAPNTAFAARLSTLIDPAA
jgi:glycosyltransferase A (GT-A) superfamily protein (DUF2064 family)